ncbi:hypothetical protein TNCV_805621 [Trichonephila clavipes]|nr:hypothetical protein TNCV_805621 [Trichonephila clavipes]
MQAFAHSLTCFLISDQTYFSVISFTVDLINTRVEPSHELVEYLKPEFLWNLLLSKKLPLVSPNARFSIAGVRPQQKSDASVQSDRGSPS